MKKKSFLLAAALMTAGCMTAETLPEGLVSLLPEGVKANISTERKLSKIKNVVVAGSPEKGYKAFFAATDEAHGEELWVTDGTPEGTKLVKDIVAGSSSSNVGYLTRFNDKVVFQAYTDDADMELWISDGTEEGTYMVKDINEIGASDPRGFTQVNETQFIFGAKDFESENYSERGAQWWLWVSDGTEEGTKMIAQCDMKFPGQDNTTWMTPYCRVGRKVFFKADNVDGTTGEELWVTDGTEAGTKFVKDINTEEIATGTANSAIDNMVNFYNEKLFFKAFSIESSNEPWASDGTEAGTYQIYDSNPTSDETGFPRGGGASDAAMYPYNGRIYFRGYTLDGGCELAATNCEQGDFKFFDINKNDPSVDNNGFADPGVEFDGVYMFCAATGFDPLKEGNYGGELHYTDGETVKMQSDLGPGVQSNWVKELTVVSGSLYWWNESSEDPEKKQKLYRIDSKDQFPVRVTNLSADGDKIHSLRNLGGDLLFATDDENKSLYCYHYRKEGFDPIKDADNLEPEYRTREEIASVEGLEQDVQSVTIYPNPAQGQFNINTTETVKTVNVYDLAGRLVMAESNLSGNQVDIHNLAQGIYKVVIETANGSYVSSLIVK